MTHTLTFIEPLFDRFYNFGVWTKYVSFVGVPALHSRPIESYRKSPFLQKHLSCVTCVNCVHLCVWRKVSISMTRQFYISNCDNDGGIGEFVAASNRTSWWWCLQISQSFASHGRIERFHRWFSLLFWSHFVEMSSNECVLKAQTIFELGRHTSKSTRRTRTRSKVRWQFHMAWTRHGVMSMGTDMMHTGTHTHTHGSWPSRRPRPPLCVCAIRDMQTTDWWRPWCQFIKSRFTRDWQNGSNNNIF